MIRYHLTNAEVGAPLKLPFALSSVSCSQDDTAISLSTEVAGYGFGEWLHVCRLQAPLPALEAVFRHWRPCSAQKGLFGDDFAAGKS